MRKAQKKAIVIDLVILVVVAIVLAVSMAFSRGIELSLGLLYPAEDGYDGDDVVMIDPRNAARSSGALYMYYLDVGQGDCTVIVFPDGKTMLIDAGDDENKVERSIQTFIDTTFDDSFKYFDYAVLTHPDSDHCGSMDYVLDKYPARVVYRPNVEAVGTEKNPYTDPGKTDLSADVKSVDTLVYAKSINVMYSPSAAVSFTPEVRVTDPARTEYDISGGSGDDAYTFTFYSPLSRTYAKSDKNNYSPITILSYRGYNFALSGDAESKNEREFVQRIATARTDGVTDKYDIFTDDYTVDTVKCGHHGSDTSTSIEYLNAITTPAGAAAAYYIISCGLNNKHGHPKPATLQTLASLNVPDSNILRTDMSGTITLSVRPDQSGKYALYNGDKASAPVEPDDPTVPDEPDDPNKPTPDDPNKPTPDEPTADDGKKPYVYVKMGSVKLTWPTVAWVGYAVLVAAAGVHILLVWAVGVKKADKVMRGKR